MKLFLLLSITFLQFMYGDQYEKTHRMVINRYPKKASQKKYINVKPAMLSKIEIAPRPSAFYTVFPVIGVQSKRAGKFPHSPYFPEDQGDEPETRVKNILTDALMTSFRKKRSVETRTTDKTIGDHAKNNVELTRRNQDRVKHSGHRRNHRHKRRRSNNIKRQGIIRLRAKPKKRTKSQKSMLRSRNKKHEKEPLKRGGDHKKSTRHEKSHRHHTDSTKVKEMVCRRLIGGRDALIEDYPYVVSIQKNNEHWCSGALLNPRIVITTANCVWKSKRVSRLKIRAGSRHTDRGGQLVGIQEVVKHPSWSIRREPDNDVALLFLDERIKFSNKVHSVDLPNRIMVPAFEDAWVASWGADRRDGIFDKHSVSLQVNYVRLMDRNKCNNVTQRYGVTVSENFICFSQNGKRAPCTRDTGAPAVSDGVLWGLASWGIRRLCGTERFPAMFSFLASQSNMDFLTNATRYFMADSRLDPNIDRFQG